jgi:hypothetical protein
MGAERESCDCERGCFSALRFILGPCSIPPPGSDLQLIIFFALNKLNKEIFY